MVSLDDIRTAARIQIAEEERYAAVELEKSKIRLQRAKKPFWHKVFPFVVTIKRR